VPSLVRPEYGPALPALLRERLGVPERTTVRVALALAGLAALIGLVVLIAHDRKEQIVAGEPTFNVQVGGPVKQVEPHAGELLRLEAKRRSGEVALTASRLDLPAYDGHVPGGLLPLVAERRITELSGQPGFRLKDEGKARFNDAPGYQMGYRTKQGRFRDTLLVPEEGPFREGVLLSFEQQGRPGKRLVEAMRDAMRSFQFGTEAP
jgi:hypothetical protein